ncbi:pirin family protein [Thioclava sp. BHET1]|nr:pirin family protein [Thioclava sp. BHET1]
MPLIHDRNWRGQTHTGWSDSFHSFSFGSFFDPNRMGIGPLRGLNEDRLIPGAGFPPQEERNIEILTLVREGTLRHADSLGSEGVLTPGAWQLLSAGTGVTHRESNASDSADLHLLQFWLAPAVMENRPQSEQGLPDAADDSGMRLVASGRAQAPIRLGSLTDVFLLEPREGGTTLDLPWSRQGFVHILDGRATIDGERLERGDGFEFQGGSPYRLDWEIPAAAVFLDLPF